MEKTELPENFRKGIDIAVRTAKKLYPFIVGWQLSETWEQYKTTVYIELIIDFEKLYKKFDWNVSGYFTSRIDRGEEVRSPALLVPFEWGNYGTEEFEKKADISHNLGKDIRKTLNQAYDFIPDEYKMTWETSFGKSQTELSVDYYIFRP
jgi:hypothetical protein